ncbi:MAG: WxL domain-containing protein [Bifidobacteriaceae bacterium]|jgi:hypothetical protein|nr:WxL domain-containing protein [Bifidobacteriaceae bacterium]
MRIKQSRRLFAIGASFSLAAGILAAPPALGAPADSDRDVLVISASRGSLSAKAFEALAGEFDQHGLDGGVALILGDSATAERLDKAGAEVLAVQTYGESISQAEPAPRPAAGKAKALAAQNYPVPARLGDTEYPTYYGGYRTVAGYEAFLEDAADAYPELVELVDYGNTWNKVQNRSGGHDLLAVRITAGADSDGDWRDHTNAKPRFFLTGQAHAREVITSELTWRFIALLLDGYGTDPEITELLKTTEVWVAPQNNPDGTELVQEGLSDPALRYSTAGDANPVNTSKAWQRKNVNDTLFNPTSTNWNSQQPGVDLNRNFATAWGGASTSATPTSTTYKGTAPFSEPETRYESELLAQLFGHFKAGTTTAAPDDRQGVFINLHSAAGLVIYPYAYDRAANVPNLEAIKALGFRQSYFNLLDTGKAGEILYNNAGNDIDWIYDELGIPAYTWEIGSSATGSFFPNYSRVDKFWAETSEALLYAAKAAAAPYKTPAGPSIVNWAAAHNADGTVKVTGAASDNLLGHDSGNPPRRPATQDVTDVQAIVGPVAAPLAGPIELSVHGTGQTVTFSGAIPVDDDVAGEAQVVHVRAKDASGAWGPWYAANLAPRPAGPGSAYQNLVLDVEPGLLTLSVPTHNTVILDPVTLSGADQTTGGRLVSVTVNNGRGTSAAWRLNGQATDFHGDNGTVIPAANLGWSPSAAFVTGSYTAPEGVNPSTVTAGSTVAPNAAGTGLGAVRTLANSPANASAGEFTAGGTVTLGVPATAKAGRYASTLTLTLQ